MMDATSVFSTLHWELWLAGAAGMLFVVAVAAGIRSLLGRRDEIVERIERTVTLSSMNAEGGTGVSDSNSESFVPLLARILRPLSWVARPGKSDELARLRTSLIRAGYRAENAMEIFLGVKLGATPIVTVLFLTVNSHVAHPIAFPTDAGIVLVLVAFAFFMPNLWLRSRTSERQKAIERALPDAMDLLVTCVEAGLGLDATIARVSEEMTLAAPLLAEELHHTFLEIQAGIPRADAFRRLADRTGVEDLRALSAMLIQTDMFGTSIAKSLRVHSESMRIRRAQRAEEKAAMISVKMTIPLIMCILPSLIAIVMGPAVAMIVKNFGGQ
jgi:tight adherence protein C